MIGLYRQGGELLLPLFRVEYMKVTYLPLFMENFYKERRWCSHLPIWDKYTLGGFQCLSIMLHLSGARKCQGGEFKKNVDMVTLCLCVLIKNEIESLL